MSQVKWCWDYEVKHLGSFPASPPYTGHNKPVKIIELSALTEVVEGLKRIRDLAKQNHTGPLDPFGDLIRIEDAAKRLLAQVGALTKEAE